MRESFEVTPPDVAAAGRQVAAAATALGKLRPDGALTAAASACPGSLLNSAGLAAANRWNESLRAACADLKRTSEALDGGAHRYARADERAAAGSNVPR